MIKMDNNLWEQKALIFKKALDDILYITDPLGHFGNDRVYKIALEATQIASSVCAKCGGSGMIGNGPTSFNLKKCDCQSN